MRWFKKRSKSEPQKQAPTRAEPAPKIQLDDPALRDDPEIQRKRVAAATDADAALKIIRELQLPQSARIPLFLARRDLSEALWADISDLDEAVLNTIEQLSRNHNKAVNREARDRIKRLRSARATMAALQDRARELSDSAQRINAGSELTTRDITARDLLEEQWQALAVEWQAAAQGAGTQSATLPPLPTLNKNLPRADELAAQARAEADQKAEQAAADAAAAQEHAAVAQAQQAASDLANRTSAALLRLEDHQPALASLLERVGATTEDDHVAPGPARLERREQRTALRNLRSQVAWPDGAAIPDSLKALDSALETVQRAIDQLDQDCKAEQQRLEEAIQTLTGTLAEGRTREAGALHADIRRARPESVGVAKSALSALSKASGELRALGSWQQFATSPKRQELCDAMAAAAQDPLEPEPQAAHIKSLRAQWQALGPPRDAADRAALKAFDASAAAAFEPCRAHFAALAEAREQNAEARKTICAQLQQYLDDTDWRSADYDAAERILREARNSWRGFYPVPRKQEAALSKQFEGLQDTLYQKLQSFWDGNARAKQALIDQARALGDDTTPLPDRIDQAKRLQSDWKRIGRVPRKRDQALWQDFRSACDAIFEARDAAATEQSARIDAQKAQVQQLLTEFSSKLAEADSQTAEKAQLQSFRGKLREQLGDLPGPLQRTLEAEAKNLMRSYQGLLDAAKQQALLKRLDDYQRWDQAAAKAPDQLPPGAPEGLFGGGTIHDADQWQEELQRLTVSMEMTADIDSPAADQPLRMALKVERLQQALSSARAAGEDVLTQAESWCRLGPKPDSAEIDALRERFFKALAMQASVASR